jgi:hypothetical protein
MTSLLCMHRHIRLIWRRDYGWRSIRLSILVIEFERFDCRVGPVAETDGGWNEKTTK